FLGQMAPLGMAHVIELGQRFAQTVFEDAAQLLLLLIAIGKRWSEAADDAGKAKERDDVEFSIGTHLSFQVFRGVAIGLQQLAIHLHGGGRTRLHVEIDVEMAAMNFFADDLAETKLVNVEALRQAEANIEEA